MDREKIKEIWPEWRIIRKIGEGSYGAVYEAERTDVVECQAAIKVISIPKSESEIRNLLSEGLSEDETRSYVQNVVSDFTEEIRLLESFKGTQNIVSIEDFKVKEKTDLFGWDVYIRMELLTPLQTYIADRKFTERDVIKLGIDICNALELCAKNGVIHRDIKPGNIFVNRFGDYKLGDFGIARTLDAITGGFSIKGTYSYMAPEVYKGIPYDERVDIYSLGIVLYQYMNRNRQPFITADKTGITPVMRENALRRRLNGEALPAPSEASPNLARIILKACENNPSKRFESATEMKLALQAHLEGKNVFQEAAPNRTVNRKGQGAVPVKHADITIDRKDLAVKREAHHEPERRKKKPSLMKRVAMAYLVLVMLVLAVLTYREFFKKENNSGDGQSIKIEIPEDVIGDIVHSDEKTNEGALSDTEESTESIENAPENPQEEEEGNCYLTEVCPPYESYDFRESDSLTMAGEEYTNGFELHSVSSSTYALFNLGGKYEQMEFDIGHIDGTSMSNATFVFYLDGEKSESITVKAESLPSHRKIKLKKAKQMKIVCEDASSYPSYGFANAVLIKAKGVVDTESSKKVEIPSEYLLTRQCEPYESYDYREAESFMMAGEEYSNGFEFKSISDSTYALFNLGGKYEQMEFDIGHIDGTNMSGVTFVFYLDGEKSESITVKAWSLPSHYKVELKKAKQMKIVCEDASSYPSYGFANAVIR